MYRHFRIVFLSFFILITASYQDDSQSKSVNGSKSPTNTTSTVINSSGHLALIIGNRDYQYAPSLRHSINDANDMAAVLTSLGFQVVVERNASKKTMVQAVTDFGTRLNQGSVGLFYFSGHGLQSKNRNYLMPTDAKINSEADIEFEGFDANQVLEQMRQANSRVNLVILDACQNNDKITKLKGLKKGLAEMISPPNTLIAFATAPNTPSWEDKPGEKHSVYTKHLLTALQTKAHWSVTDLLIQVRGQVMQETQHEEVQQIPWESVSLTQRFCFGGCEQPKSPHPEIPKPAPSLAFEISRLLQKCENHFKANRLTIGKGGTALVCYKQVLEKDPTNAEALAGLEKIETRYATWTNKALNRGRLEQAKRYLARLRQVNSNSPKLADLEERIAKFSSKVDFAALLQPKQGRFETTPQFQTRRQQLLAEFNQAVHQGDLRYQAGTAYLTDYNADTKELLVNLTWQATWIKQLLDSIIFKKQGIAKIEPDDAQALWQTNRNKPLFVQVEMVKNHIVTKGALVERGEVFFMSLSYYTDNGNGTITDQRNKLIWLKNANCFGGQDWETAMKSAANLAHGQCGLHDGSKRGMWRLPTKEEWEAMVDNRYEEPAFSKTVGTSQWKEGDAFSGVQTSQYWSSTTYANNTNNAWGVYINNGNINNYDKTYSCYVWPVRSGV